MEEIQTYDFAAYDALLYLDAYPDSQAALDFYNKYKNLEDQAIIRYEQKYGPITMPDGNTYSWQWSEGPWPWQIEGKR
jgi:spore coat protein JB